MHWLTHSTCWLSPFAPIGLEDDDDDDDDIEVVDAEAIVGASMHWLTHSTLWL